MVFWCFFRSFGSHFTAHHTSAVNRKTKKQMCFLNISNLKQYMHAPCSHETWLEEHDDGFWLHELAGIFLQFSKSFQGWFHKEVAPGLLTALSLLLHHKKHQKTISQSSCLRKPEKTWAVGRVLLIRKDKIRQKWPLWMFKKLNRIMRFKGSWVYGRKVHDAFIWHVPTNKQ